MTKAITLTETKADVQRLKEIRLQIKELAQKQVDAKMAKAKSTDQMEVSRIQSQMHSQRQAIAALSVELATVHSRLSQVPYGRSNPVSKKEDVSKELDIVKASYKQITMKQHELKKAIQSSQFTTVDALSGAQKEKARNVKTINRLTQKRTELKRKYKMLSDVLFAETEQKQAA